MRHTMVCKGISWRITYCFTDLQYRGKAKRHKTELIAGQRRSAWSRWKQGFIGNWKKIHMTKACLLQRYILLTVKEWRSILAEMCMSNILLCNLYAQYNFLRHSKHIPSVNNHMTSIVSQPSQQKCWFDLQIHYVRRSQFSLWSPVSQAVSSSSISFMHCTMGHTAILYMYLFLLQAGF